MALPAADLGAFALRLLGVKIAVDVFSQLPLGVAMRLAGNAIAPLMALGVWAVWSVFVALVLLGFARPIARSVFGNRSIATADLGVPAWMTLIVSGAGLTFALFCVGDAITAIQRASVVAGMQYDPLITSQTVVPLVKAALGGLLFFKPSLLVSPWLRRVATDRTPAEA